ncbi:MAG TPA: GNAT family N-acetyltransferase [Rhizomicrobium sp.]|nr:GNAT family N-acetyltransferase [Rhizomicrobium sp.]
MQITEASVADIAEIQRVRMSVRENILGDPSRVTPADIERMIEQGGKGWVCRADGVIRGFSFADQTNANVWALFIEPGYDHRGMGRMLHDLAVAWLFDGGAQTIWLSTEPHSRAEKFYRIAGWQQTDVEPNGDLRLELDRKNWNQ